MRDNKKVFYGSSYDRGLINLLEMWPDIKKAVPKATLEIAYGWQIFDKMFYNNPERQGWKMKIEGMMKSDGITHHNRLTQIEVLKLMEQCGVFAYPTDFYEISCITAMKAQALGLTPVVINYGALSETVQYGIKIDGEIWDKERKEKYKQALIKILQNPQEEKERQTMMKWASDTYSWKTVINLWLKEFYGNV